jgi:hypothetical protein
MIIFDLFKALKAGEEIANPAAWKKGTILTSAIGIIVGTAFKILAPNFDVPPDLTNIIVEALAAILVGINIFMTKVTSKKV